MVYYIHNILAVFVAISCLAASSFSSPLSVNLMDNKFNVTLDNNGTHMSFNVITSLDPLSGISVTRDLVWLAVGISTNPISTDSLYGAQMTVCGTSYLPSPNTNLKVQQFYSISTTTVQWRYLASGTAVGITEPNVAIVGDKLTCSFVRQNIYAYPKYLNVTGKPLYLSASIGANGSPLTYFYGTTENDASTYSVAMPTTITTTQLPSLSLLAVNKVTSGR